MFITLEDMAVSAAEMVRPPERLTVAEAAEKYRWVNVPGAYVGPWRNDTTPYMIEPMDTLASDEYTGLIFVGPAQSGKALPLKTPIATPTGWTRMGDLKVGDLVFGSDGRPVRVIFATETMTGHDCYRITFDDGTQINADADHKWAVTNRHGTRRVLTTREMLADHRVLTAKGGRRSNYAIDMPGPLALPDADLPLDPYALGVWLGDGAVHTGYLCLNETDVGWITARLGERGVSAVPYENRFGRSVYTVAAHVADGRTLKSVLRSMGYAAQTGSKFIPPAYLRASEAQRRELLRGLMDTDGTAVQGGVIAEWASSDFKLVCGFRELLWSLGIKHRVCASIPKYTYKGEAREGRVTHKITFATYEPEQVFSLPRHIESARASRATRQSYTTRRWITSIAPTPSVPVRCIQVDAGDSLFLAGPQMVPTHNTDALLMNWLAYTAVCDPMDMMIVQMSQSTARDFAKRRVERLFRHSKAVGEKVLPGRQNQNTYDTKFKSGMLLTLSWPTINELSGKPIGRLALTDYDRMDQDVDGEGSPFDLTRKRATTFGRHGMTAAESSPGFEVENPRWIGKTAHEAPPTRGILALYNRGDRRRWYWRCPHCREAFEPDFKLLVYPDSADLMEAAEAAEMACPNCGGMISHDRKKELNIEGRWIKDGQLWLPDGTVAGTPVRSDIASFWQKGVTAAFASWKTLVLNYLKAMDEYSATGSQEALKTTVNTDQGLPFTPIGQGSDLLPEDLRSRAQDFGEKIVPPGVRFMVATIDVQKSRFVVQVLGFMDDGDHVVIDRFDIKKSERVDEDGERLWVKPGTYEKDWHLLVPEVIEKTYPLDDETGRRMQIKAVACDSGGNEGMTANAYAFWRWLRDEHGLGHHRRFRLIKGSSLKTAPRVQTTYPDAERRDRRASARGEVPILSINVNLVKDQVAAMLDRKEPGTGRILFPEWLPDSFFSELCAEVRTPRGWENPRKLRNEAFDLLVYAMAVSITPAIGIERLDWADPPRWAAPWDENDLVSVEEETTKRFEHHAKADYDLGQLGNTLA